MTMLVYSYSFPCSRPRRRRYRNRLQRTVRIVKLRIEELTFVDGCAFAENTATWYTDCMRKQTFQLVFESDPAGGYTVTVPVLPGCVTYGATMDKARAMAREAIELYLEDLIANNEEIPSSTDTLVGAVEVQVAV